MKKYIIIAVLLLSATAYGFGGLLMGSGTVVVSAGATWSCTDADLLCERFEGAEAGYDITGWTAVTTNGTPDPDLTIPAGFTCGVLGDDAHEMPHTGDGIAGSRYDLGSGQTLVYGQVAAMYTSENLANNDYVYFVQLGVNSNLSTHSFGVGVWETGGAGTKYVNLTYYNGSSFSTIQSSEISIDTQYIIGFMFNTSTGDVELWLDGVSQGSNTNAGNRPPQYVLVGSTNSDINVHINVVGGLKLDASAMPDLGCS